MLALAPMPALAFSRLRETVDPPSAVYVTPQSRFGPPPPYPAARRGPGTCSSGQARVAYVIIAALAAVCVVAILVLPDFFGRRAEKIYRDNVNQLTAAGYAIRLDSYQRGWFVSRATLTLPASAGAQVIVQRIHHGPLGFYDGWMVAFPVAAVIETQPPAKLENSLDKSLGKSPLTITTVVSMDGAMDTYISRDPSERRDSTHHMTVKFMGFQAELRYSHNRSAMHGGTPGITGTGAFGEAGVRDVTIGGRYRRAASATWVGSTKIYIGRIGYSMVSTAHHHSSTGLAQGVSVSLVKSMKNGKIDLREKVGAQKISGRKLEAGPMSLLFEISNISPEQVLKFRKDTAAISLSRLDKQARAKALRAKLPDLLTAMLKQSPPLLSLELKVSSPKGDATGQARMGIDPGFANDPMLKAKVPPQLLFALLAKKYGHFSGNAEAPAAFLEQMVGAKHLNELQQAHILVQNGADYVVSASYQEGKFLVNGRKYTPPPPRPCPPAKRPHGT